MGKEQVCRERLAFWFLRDFLNFLYRSQRQPISQGQLRLTRLMCPLFLTNYECLKRAIYSPSDIYNADENGCTTVQSVRKAKVIACRNKKQVGKLTSGERGALITVLYAVNAAGNSVPPMLVFPE